MKHSATCVALVREFEGCRLTAYQDSGGVWTIGYGHTSGVGPNQVCTEEQALVWLDDDLAISDAAVNRLVTVRITQNQFDALVDFDFNDGEGNLERSSLLKFLNIGQSLLAAREFGKWIYAAGQVEPGLVRRRAAEQTLFLTQ